MSSPETDRPLLPPYCPPRTFFNFLDGLKVALPAQIDRSVMPTVSGAMQGWLLNAMRFLGLIMSNGVPTGTLKKLVTLSGEEEKAAHRAIIKAAYSFLFTEHFDLKTATPKMLEARFAETGAQGDTIRKCIVFFVGYAASAELALSPHLAKATSRPRSSPKKRQVSQSSNPPWTAPAPLPAITNTNGRTWQQMMLTKFPDFDPSWPDDVKAKWFEGFERLMKFGEEGGFS
jgi:hypothetical protein